MRALLRPRWLLAHLLVLAVAVLFVNLGLWQLRRLEQRRADNALIEQNMAPAPAPLDRVLARHGQDPSALTYRRVVVDGTYRPEEEVLLTPRSHQGRAGHHVLTPLVVAQGGAVLVDRGWVPFEDDVPPVGAAAPPAGPVTVTGVLIPTRQAARSGTRGGGDDLTYLSSADVDQLQPQISVPLQPFSVLLQQQRPEPRGLPVPGPPPEISEGSHQSYAWQWFSFTAILLAGYPLLVRRSLRGSGSRP